MIGNKIQSGQINLSCEQRVAFVQSFGISAPGGGSRILRALLKDAPAAWKSFATGSRPPVPAFGTEMHLAARPFFGRLENTRLRPFFEMLGPLFENRLQRRLEKELIRFRATAVHSIPHGSDFVIAWRISVRLGLRFFVSIHDDLIDTVARSPTARRDLIIFKKIWREADARFVISEPLGVEYSSRYGKRPYEIITDGTEAFCEPRPCATKRINIYFMGLFHVRYEPNLECLIRAVEILHTRKNSLVALITLRCGKLRSRFKPVGADVRVLPFGTESQVESDFNDADLLYLPLPFGTEDIPFVRFSLSTKMVTYLASGIPILFHGPENSAAHKILSESEAAFVFNSLRPEDLADLIEKIIANPEISHARVANSLKLARLRFRLQDQRARFWSKILCA